MARNDVELKPELIILNFFSSHASEPIKKGIFTIKNTTFSFTSALGRRVEICMKKFIFREIFISLAF